MKYLESVLLNGIQVRIAWVLYDFETSGFHVIAFLNSLSLMLFSN